MSYDMLPWYIMIIRSKSQINRKYKSKYLLLLPILLLLHGCGFSYLAGIKVKPTSPESVNSSINVSAMSSVKPKVLEIVHQVAEKYGFQKTTLNLFERLLSGSLLVKYNREPGDEGRRIKMHVWQRSSNSFEITFEEFPAITQSKIGKQIQADLVIKLSESIGKEFIITQYPR
jgi:hypothetical protein